MRLPVAAFGLAIAFAPGTGLAQNDLTDEDYLLALENAASACLYFSALTHLPVYDAAIAEEVVTRVCDVAIRKLDEEGCRIDGGTKQEQAQCVAAKIYSDVLVTSTVNMMRMVDEAYRR